MRSLLDMLMAEVDAEVDECIADAQRMDHVQLQDLLLIHGVDLTGVQCTRRNRNTLFWILVESYQHYRAARYREIRAQLEASSDSTKCNRRDGAVDTAADDGDHDHPE